MPRAPPVSHQHNGKLTAHFFTLLRVYHEERRNTEEFSFSFDQGHRLTITLPEGLYFLFKNCQFIPSYVNLNMTKLRGEFSNMFEIENKHKQQMKKRCND